MTNKDIVKKLSVVFGNMSKANITVTDLHDRFLRQEMEVEEQKMKKLLDDIFIVYSETYDLIQEYNKKV